MVKLQSRNGRKKSTNQGNKLEVKRNAKEFPLSTLLSPLRLNVILSLAAPRPCSTLYALLHFCHFCTSSSSIDVTTRHACTQMTAMGRKE